MVSTMVIYGWYELYGAISGTLDRLTIRWYEMLWMLLVDIVPSYW